MKAMKPKKVPDTFRVPSGDFVQYNLRATSIERAEASFGLIGRAL